MIFVCGYIASCEYSINKVFRENEQGYELIKLAFVHTPGVTDQSDI